MVFFLLIVLPTTISIPPQNLPGWDVPEGLEGTILIGLGIFGTWYLSNRFLEYLNRRKISKHKFVSLIPIACIKDGNLYRGIIDYNDPNGFILTLLYLNESVSVFKNKVRYQGRIYTAIFWVFPKRIGSTTFYSPLDEVVTQTLPGRILTLTGISMRFCGPNRVQWQLLTLNYNIRINFKYFPYKYITPYTDGIMPYITVWGLYRDISWPFVEMVE